MTPSEPKKSYHQPNEAFEREAEVVLKDLQPAIAEILQRLRPPVRRAAHLQEILNLSPKLSWSMFTAANAQDVRALASLLPKHRGMERFFLASAKHGVPEETIERARAAFGRFEEAVVTHAGSRDAFETMVAEVNSPGTNSDSTSRDGVPGGSGADLKHKRTAFRTNSLLWGRQARVFCATRILRPAAPSASPGILDGVLIRGMVGLRRTRRAVTLHTMEHQWRANNPGDPAEPTPPEPLDPREARAVREGTDDGADVIGLLRDFCSKPLPEFRLCESQQGYRCHELVNESLGASGEVTYFTGEIYRAESVVPGQVPGSRVTLTKTMGIPTEAFIGDILMHRSVWGTRPPEVQVYAFPLDGSRQFRESDLLPVTESAEYLGEGLYAARTPLLPRYEELLSYAMDRMGWNADEFRVFRCRVDYPILTSRVRIMLR